MQLCPRDFPNGKHIFGSTAAAAAAAAAAATPAAANPMPVGVFSWTATIVVVDWTKGSGGVLACARATRSATLSAHRLAAPMAVLVLVLVLVVVVMVPLSGLTWQTR
jgi:hypothetical protein